MPTPGWLGFISAFFVALVIEVVYVAYTVCVVRGHVFPAMFASGAISILGSALTLGFVDNHQLIVAVTLGEMLGTFIVLRLLKQRDSQAGEK